jgi:hypothetical protein
MAKPIYRPVVPQFEFSGTAAFAAISFRRAGVSALARALLPARPLRTFPADFLLPGSSNFPIAIRMTWTALPMTSAGRFSPLGPLGMPCPCICFALKHILRGCDCAKAGEEAMRASALLAWTFGAALAATWVGLEVSRAQQPPAPPYKVIQLMKAPFTADPNKETVMIRVEWPPNVSTQWHTHPGDEYATVLEGSVISQIEGGGTEEDYRWPIIS